MQSDQSKIDQPKPNKFQSFPIISICSHTSVPPGVASLPSGLRPPHPSNPAGFVALALRQRAVKSTRTDSECHGLVRYSVLVKVQGLMDIAVSALSAVRHSFSVSGGNSGNEGNEGRVR